MSVCICTSADHVFIKDLFILLYSLKKSNVQNEIYIYDLGLTDEDKEDIYHVDLKITILSIDFFIYGLKKGRTDRIYIKPFLIRDLFEKTNHNIFWIDADALILNSYKTLFLLKILEKKTFFTKTSRSKKVGYNKPELYNLFPVKNMKGISLNAGIFGMNREYINTILKDWCWMAENAFNDKSLRKYIVAWDQGCLIWALENSLDKNYIILDNHYNLGISNFILEKNISNMKTIEEIWDVFLKSFSDKAVILHCWGELKIRNVISFSHKDILSKIQKG